ncbi:MAG: hypothetical protein II811_02280 [Spirochaetaceae bacterium]|nr:hypothetical protein [Spirochaetaceae bacterium]
MEQNELVELIAKLRDESKTNDFEDKRTVFEHLYKNGDEKIRDLIRSDFNRLANDIADELEQQKKGF